MLNSNPIIEQGLELDGLVELAKEAAKPKGKKGWRRQGWRECFLRLH